LRPLNPDGLHQAIDLYRASAYRDLKEAFGAENIFILSAGTTMRGRHAKIMPSGGRPPRLSPRNERKRIRHDDASNRIRPCPAITAVYRTAKESIISASISIRPITGDASGRSSPCCDTSWSINYLDFTKFGSADY
jgi:hypothetical protein